MDNNKFLDYNNELREQLNAENKIKYENLLFKIRTYGFFKNEKQIEITLLEMLQDLIANQERGKNFDDVFGKDIDRLAKDIVGNSKKESIKKSTQVISLAVVTYLASNLFLSISSTTFFNYGIYLVDKLVTFALFFVALFFIINHSHKLSKYGELFALATFSGIIVASSPIVNLVINKTNLFASQSFIIEITTFRLLIIFLITTFAILLIGYIFNNILLFATLLISQTLALITMLLFKTEVISASYETQQIAVSGAITLGLILSIVIVLKVVKR